MTKYRKKPVVVEAFCWLKDEVPSWFRDVEKWVEVDINDNGAAIIQTLEGRMRANEGDYIIKGVQGEIYPCKPVIFEATYEKVED